MGRYAPDSTVYTYIHTRMHTHMHAHTHTHTHTHTQFLRTGLLRVGEILQIFCAGLEEQIAHRKYFYKSATLVHEGMVMIHNSGITGDPTTAIVSHLLFASISMSVLFSCCWSVYLSVCLSVCLFACLSVCLSVCLSATSCVCVVSLHACSFTHKIFLSHRWRLIVACLTSVLDWTQSSQRLWRALTSTFLRPNLNRYMEHKTTQEICVYKSRLDQLSGIQMWSAGKFKCRGNSMY